MRDMFQGLDALRQDLRHSVRILWRSPGFTLTAMAVLAVGMGANLAMLHILNAAFFHRLSIRDADSIIQFQPLLPYPVIAFYREQAGPYVLELF
jgi:hypothetical protein